MEVGDLTAAGELLELLDGADTDDLLHVIGGPDRDGVTPVSVSGEAPVSGALEPVLESLLLDEARHPGRVFVLLDDLVLDVSHLDEPRVNGTVHQRSLGPPAVGVAMHDGALGHKSAAVLQVLDDFGISVLEIDTSPLLDGREELAIIIHGHDNLTGLNEALGNAHVVIFLTEAGSAMDYTSTAVLGNEGAVDDGEALLLAHVLEVGEEGSVLLSDEIFTWNLLEYLMVLYLGLLQHVLQSALSKDELLVVLSILNLNVGELGVDGASQVGGQGPGSGSPCQQAGLGVLQQREGDIDGGILSVLVVGASLEVGEYGVASGGERHNSGATVDEIFIEDLLESPPDGLHEVAVHGLVVIFEINPSSEPADNLLPLLGVRHDDFAASSVVLLHSDLLSLDGGLDVVLLVDLVLDGQAVAIPSESSLAVMSGLSGISGHAVLDGTSGDVSVMREASSERRPIVEGVGLPAFREFELLVESIDLRPVGEDLLFLGGEVGSFGNFVELRLHVVMVRECFTSLISGLVAKVNGVVFH
mmetsp:Transcript_5114/g.7795  ORF Transcript_5114/g.7795 Transcript_5114/m.7795 type:complete len:530 (-) Transcript_5114:157-1746(-)